MDRSEWVLVPKVATEEMIEAMSREQAGHAEWPSDFGEIAQFNRREFSRLGWGAMLSAAPPPPAEQASGEWSRAANELRRAEALANKSNKIDRHKVIGKAANDNLSAILDALSQRPVVDEAITGDATARFARAGGWLEIDGLCHDQMNALDGQRVTVALAPQQPEKGEG